LKQKDSVSEERGSMLPFFAGLIALSLVLALGAAQICAGFIFREGMQQVADQLSLVAVAKKISLGQDAAKKLTEITSRYSLESFGISDGQTVELTLCSDFVGWLQLPGLKSKEKVCVNSAAR
jgi:hypothetical protein